MEMSLDINFINQYIPLYIEAAKLTIRLGVIGILLALMVGFICAMIQYFKIPVLRQIVAVYKELSRNTPLLIFLY